MWLWLLLLHGWCTLHVVHVPLHEGQRLHCTQVAMEDREERMASVQAKIETGLHLVGATAVEDKLQVW